MVWVWSGLAALLVWMVAWVVFYRYRLGRLTDIESHFTKSLAARHQDVAEYAWLQRHHHEFVELMKGADVIDSSLAYAEPVGWGQIATGTTSAMQNWLMLRDDSVRWTFRAIEQARGVYQRRLLSSMNPIHWGVMALTLPMQAVKWVGGNPDGSLSRALTVLWWLVGALALLLGFWLDVLDVFAVERRSRAT